MRKILLYKYVDIFNNTDYKKLQDKCKKDFNGSCPNFGNKLWYQGLYSEISTDGNIIDYYNNELSFEEINEKYDLVIYTMANIFSKEFSVGLDLITEKIKKFKIPVFIISCGAQADSYDDLDELCNSIGECSKRFIKAVYDTGGQFALRGHFTNEFFKKLGFNDAAVVGCPSLFQCGRNLKINKRKVSSDSFKPAINGNLNYVANFLNKYKNSIFYDQDIFYNYLYNSEYFDNGKSDFCNKLKMASSDNGMLISSLINDNRIRLIADMWDWKNNMLDEEICFSFGTRIHGNILALLSGIPAVVVGWDSRTREMAEFYDIPCIIAENFDKNADLYEMYDKLDYSNFNKKFAEKYDAFNSFLVGCGIVSKMNENNTFMNKKSNFETVYLNEKSKKYAEDIINKKTFYSIGNKLKRFI